MPGWPDDGTQAAHRWLTGYLGRLGIPDAADRAMEIVIEIRGMGWRPTIVGRGEPWQQSHRPAGADTARATAAQIRSAMGWIPTTPDEPDSTGDEKR